MEQCFCKRLPSHSSRAGLHWNHPVVWSFLRLYGCHLAENGQIHRKLVVECPLAITSIGETLFQTRKEELLVQPVFCIVDTGTCFFFFHLLVSFSKSGKISFDPKQWLLCRKSSDNKIFNTGPIQPNGFTTLIISIIIALLFLILINAVSLGASSHFNGFYSLI